MQRAKYRIGQSGPVAPVSGTWLPLWPLRRLQEDVI